jgi:hypothetical protein
MLYDATTAAQLHSTCVDAAHSDATRDALPELLYVCAAAAAAAAAPLKICATLEDVRKAYRALAPLLHPDKVLQVADARVRGASSCAARTRITASQV